MIDIILGHIYHYLFWAWPYYVTIGSLALVNIGMFYLGRWVEHRKWRRDIMSGKRLGELSQQQIKKRDTRIRQLTRVIKYREDQIERVSLKHRRMIQLSQKMVDIAVSEDNETLRRRKRA